MTAMSDACARIDYGTAGSQTGSAVEEPDRGRSRPHWRVQLARGPPPAPPAPLPPQSTLAPANHMRYPVFFVSCCGTTDLKPFATQPWRCPVVIVEILFTLPYGHFANFILALIRENEPPTARNGPTPLLRSARHAAVNRRVAAQYVGSRARDIRAMSNMPYSFSRALYLALLFTLPRYDCERGNEFSDAHWHGESWLPTWQPGA